MTGKPSKSKTPANQAILQGLITDTKPNLKEEEHVEPPKAEIPKPKDQKKETKKNDTPKKEEKKVEPVVEEPEEDDDEEDEDDDIGVKHRSVQDAPAPNQGATATAAANAQPGQIANATAIASAPGTPAPPA